MAAGSPGTGCSSILSSEAQDDDGEAAAGEAEAEEAVEVGDRERRGS